MFEQVSWNLNSLAVICFDSHQGDVVVEPKHMAITCEAFNGCVILWGESALYLSTLPRVLWVNQPSSVSSRLPENRSLTRASRLNTHRHVVFLALQARRAETTNAGGVNHRFLI